MTATLTAEQQRKLARIANRTTAYETAVVKPNGEQRLLGYCARRSQAGLMDAARKRATDILAWLNLGETAHMTKRRNPGPPCTIGLPDGSRIIFTGRTQRDAIMAGELPFIGRMEGGGV